MTDFYTYPTSDIDMGNWAGSYADVDDIQDSEDTPDEATTEITNGSAGLSNATFNLANHSAEEGAITNVRVYWRGMRAGNAQPDAQSILTIGGTTEYGVSHELGTGWVTYSDDWAQNPDDSQDWEWADIDALICGIRGQGGAGTREANITAIWIVVTYTSDPMIAPRGHVDDYRNDHQNIIHAGDGRIDHTSYVNDLISDLEGLGFTDINDFFNQSRNANAVELGYDDFDDYYADCYDGNGDIISGKEATVASYNGKWK